MPGKLHAVGWMGGKGRMLGKLFPLFPAHEHYVEPFGGAATVLLNKAPCGGVETYNDIDEGLVNFFRVIADSHLFGKFRRRVEALPVSRKIWEISRDEWFERSSELDQSPSVELAAAWFVVASQSFGGKFGKSWGSVVENATQGRASTISVWLSRVERLPAIHARLQNVQIECADWRDVLRRYNGPGYLAYCDPPYVPETRRAGEFEHELTGADHVEMVEALLGYDGAVVLSGYPSPTYLPLEEAGWERRDFEVTCSTIGRTRGTGLKGRGNVGRKQRRTESVWRNRQAVVGSWIRKEREAF